jgi:TRAP transporter TAXI family solute receptor
VVSLCILLLPIGVAPKPKPLPETIAITGYPTGSLATILITAWAGPIENITGMKVRPIPSDTDVGRLLPIRRGEAVAAVITAATAYFVSNGMEEFSAEDWGPQRIRLVYAGNRVPAGIAVKAVSGIRDWADLKGKRLAWPPGVFSLILKACLAYAGLTPDDVVKVPVGGYTAGIKAVMEGTADACFASHITPTMKEWESAPYGLYWLPIDPKNKEGIARLKEITPFFAVDWITYGALGVNGPHWNLVYPYLLVTYDFVDENVIYHIVKALDKGYDRYKDVYPPSSGEWTLEYTLNLTKPVYIPFHPGVIKYAKEKGLWTAQHEAWQSKMLKEEEERMQKWQAQKQAKK